MTLDNGIIVNLVLLLILQIIIHIYYDCLSHTFISPLKCLSFFAMLSTFFKIVFSLN